MIGLILMLGLLIGLATLVDPVDGDRRRCRASRTPSRATPNRRRRGGGFGPVVAVAVRVRSAVDSFG